MEERDFTGNCLKGSGTIRSFDSAFDSEPHLRVLKELFMHTFGVPQGARKSKPFVDHVMGFSVADGKIWIRNYQVSETEQSLTNKDDKDAAGKSKADITLIEIGPRLVATPIVIQEGSFGGPIIYENKEFVSPNQVRADLRRAKATRHSHRAEQAMGRLSRHKELGVRSDGNQVPRGALDKRDLFA